MPHKQRSQIYEDVVNLLKTGSYTTLQIAENTNINWETAKNAVETLTKINLITPTEKNGKTYYQVNETNFLQLRKDTLLGLPLTAEQEKTTKALLTRIKQRWQEITGKSISKTFQQKILVRLVEENKIPHVPYGWYLFGECAVLFSTEDNIAPTLKYDEQINEIISEYSSYQNTNELLQHYYTAKGNEQYLLRLRISTLLLEPFNADSLLQLKKKVRDFLFTLHGTEDNKDIVGNLNAFASMVFRLINHKNEREVEDLRPLLNDTFSSLWESIATNNLYQSLTKNKEWYDTATVQRFYKLRLEMVQEIVDNYLMILNDQTPTLELPPDNPLQKFKGILALQSQ